MSYQARRDFINFLVNKFLVNTRKDTIENIKTTHNKELIISETISELNLLKKIDFLLTTKSLDFLFKLDLYFDYYQRIIDTPLEELPLFIRTLRDTLQVPEQFILTDEENKKKEIFIQNILVNYKIFIDFCTKVKYLIDTNKIDIIFTKVNYELALYQLLEYPLEEFKKTVDNSVINFELVHIKNKQAFLKKFYEICKDNPDTITILRNSIKEIEKLLEFLNFAKERDIPYTHDNYSNYLIQKYRERPIVRLNIKYTLLN